MSNSEYIPEGKGNQDEVETYTEHIMNQYLRINKLPLGDRRKLRPVVDYAYRKGYFISEDDQTVDLWGFGNVPVVMEDPETETSWIALKSLVEPTGMTERELISAFREYEDLEVLPDGEIINIKLSSVRGTTHAILMVSVDFAQLLFMEYSPWSTLIKTNLSKLVLREFYESGAYKHSQVAIHSMDENGNISLVGTRPMKEYFEEHGVPSEEEALQEAYRGISVDLFKGGPPGGTEIVDDD